MWHICLVQVAGNRRDSPLHYNSSSSLISPPGPLHFSHHLIYCTIVCLPLCLSRRGLLRMHSVLTSPICVFFCLPSPFGVAVWRILPLSIHLYCHPLFLIVHGLLFKGLFSSFVSPLCLSNRSIIVIPPGSPNSPFLSLYTFTSFLFIYSPSGCKTSNCFCDIIVSGIILSP